MADLQAGLEPWSRSGRAYPTEQDRILRLLIEPDGHILTRRADGIRSLVAELASEQAAAPKLGQGAMTD